MTDEEQCSPTTAMERLTKNLTERPNWFDPDDHEAHRRMAAERDGNYIGCGANCQSAFVMYPELLAVRAELAEMTRENNSVRAALHLTQAQRDQVIVDHDAEMMTLVTLRNIHREHGPTTNGMHCCTADREAWPCRTIMILDRRAL